MQACNFSPVAAKRGFLFEEDASDVPASLRMGVVLYLVLIGALSDRQEVRP